MNESESEHEETESSAVTNAVEAASATSQKRQKRTPEDTRHTLANTYIWGFLIIVVVVFVFSFFKNLDTNGVKDLLLTTSAILSGPLGFIIGYYFKSKEG